ncbi:Single-stranded DNA-binding protein Short=SSB [Fibrisoma limi BUZ 3]|uniref:Single-stranded DNA-binding protein n=1 Tax=Fibrisoma limi BUZ 3 TaxID=1185876 RepID=I2GEP0_9BACT|nr:single-stranded DNA-binding protein [Fibrisoma limi]CCH52365.1 Single-stranded DNA-binding protein Short=SSB [Fibrisoma limi BUZ 3]
MQQLQIIGRLGQDAVTRESNGRKFVSFSVAVDDDYKDQNGQKVERTNWYDCTTEQLAVAQYLTKGTLVFAQGKPRIDQYTKDGKVYATCRLNASKIQLLSKPQDQPTTQQPAPALVTAEEKDLPF